MGGRAHINIDVCSRSDSSPAQNPEGALEVRKDVPISGAPAPCLFRTWDEGPGEYE